uniref:Uncharacterized protein n=1 Tax=Tetradesmus obliquus TaxID=3088 RepID=A0A383VG79_TETOB|eukprot:jgi/Sobl393_1/14254/SZX63742.1
MRLQLTVLLLLVGLAAGTSVRQLSASSTQAAGGSPLQGRRLAGNGGGKGGTLNSLGLVISSKSSILGSSTVDRIRAIDASARHLDHEGALSAGATPIALELLQQQPNRRLAGNGGGKGGTLNSLGLVISSKSSLLGGTTADRIRAIDASARHFDHEPQSAYAAATLTALELLQQQPNRRLAGNGGGKGGTLNNLGLAVSSRSSLLGGTTADRIRAIAVEAEAGDEAQATDISAEAVLAAAGARRHPEGVKPRLQRVLLQAGGIGSLGGGFGAASGNGGRLINTRDITESLEQRKADAAISSMISRAVNGDMDVMSAVTARQQGRARAWEMSLGRDSQQQLNGSNAGRKLLLA